MRGYGNKTDRALKKAEKITALICIIATFILLAYQCIASPTLTGGNEEPEVVQASMVPLATVVSEIPTQIPTPTSTPTPTAVPTATPEPTVEITPEPTPGCPEVIGEPDPVYSFMDKERKMLLQITMAEAEGEPLKGKAMVMRVVLNRLEGKKYPNTIEGVIFAEGQFSPILDGRYYTVIPDDDCYEALDMVLNGWDESQGATYFRTIVDYETWHSRSLQHLFDLGKHAFYKEYDE